MLSLVWALVATAGAVELELDTFETRTAASQFTFLKYYSPRCGHCKKLAPTWDQLEKALGSSALVGSVDCTGAAKSLCADVKSYPTLTWRATADAPWQTYSGGRDLGALSSFAAVHLPRALSSQGPAPSPASSARPLHPPDEVEHGDRVSDEVEADQASWSRREGKPSKEARRLSKEARKEAKEARKMYKEARREAKDLRREERRAAKAGAFASDDESTKKEAKAAKAERKAQLKAAKYAGKRRFESESDTDDADAL